MKHKTLHATLGHDKSLKNILYVWNGMSQNQKISKPIVFGTIGKDEVLVNPIRGKAPPGCSRSPGLGRGHPPAKEADRPENKGDPPDQVRSPGVNSGPHPLPELVEGKTQHCNEYKYINKDQKLIITNI